MVLNNEIPSIEEIKLYAGSSTDYSLNTECDGGRPVTNWGVVNCFASGASYIHILFLN